MCYKNKIRFHLFFSIFTLLLILPFFSTSQNLHAEQFELESYEWIQENTAPDSYFFVQKTRANEFMYYTNRATFADTSSFESQEGMKRITVQTKLYETHFESFALNLIEENRNDGRSTYILWEKSYLRIYEQKPLFLDGVCFPKLYENGNLQLYQVNCLEVDNE